MPKDKNILFMAIATLITTALWIGIEVITTYKETSFTEVNQETLSPIDSDINFEGVLR